MIKTIYKADGFTGPLRCLLSIPENDDQTKFIVNPLFLKRVNKDHEYSPYDFSYTIRPSSVENIYNLAMYNDFMSFIREDLW